MILKCSCREDGLLPSYAHDGDAAMDLRCAEEAVEIDPGYTIFVGTGLSIELPPQYAALVLPRSGIACKKDVIIPNSPGLIDSGYRGEIKVALRNLGEETVYFKYGDRIAQLLVLGLEHLIIANVGIDMDTERGTGGFGSTGLE
jgi:dUTP pyrophosphatase